MQIGSVKEIWQKSEMLIKVEGVELQY